MERKSRRALGISTLRLSVLVVAVTLCARADDSFLGAFSTITTVASTVPRNGDVNPYGVARVPVSTGKLVQGRFLVSNFNDSANLQGTGTTIVQIAPNGKFGLFAHIDPSTIACPGGVGLTTALVALRSGFVVVGSLPTSDGTAATALPGCLIVLDSRGTVVETFAGNGINGPWDMTAVDGGTVAALFVTNVLNGTVAANGSVVRGGTVLRLLLQIPDSGPPQLVATTVIGSGFPERTDPGALVIGPTGVGFDSSSGTLYVADSLSNRIAAISNALFRTRSAGTGSTISNNGALNDPLGLALAPNGHVVTANGNDGNLVETDPRSHQQVAVKLVDNSGSPPGAGALFGLAVVSDGIYFVDDAANTFNLLH